MNHFNMFDTLFKKNKMKNKNFFFLEKRLRTLKLNKEFINI